MMPPAALLLSIALQQMLMPAAPCTASSLLLGPHCSASGLPPTLKLGSACQRLAGSAPAKLLMLPALAASAWLLLLLLLLVRWCWYTTTRPSAVPAARRPSLQGGYVRG